MVSWCSFFYFFFVINNFYFYFFHTTQQNIQNKTKQNSRHTQHLRFIKREERGKDNKNTKVTPLIITYIQQKHCQASMVEGLAPPTRAVVYSHDTICRRLRIQYASLPHVWCKPVLNYCLLHSCKTSKQHSLLH